MIETERLLLRPAQLADLDRFAEMMADEEAVGWPGTEVGWSLHPDAWGKGYAVESARAMMDYAFGTLGWTDIIHCINPGNVRSQQVATRLGSRLRGPGALPAPYEHDRVDVWGQTRDEWNARAR